MLGLYFTAGNQHVDHYTLQHHVADHAYSDVLYKGAAKDRSRTVYAGLIKLEPGAQKTDAYQTNRNLLLSPDARADSVPQLEIGANDVKCSHGSSTAPVDATQLFYLMSRGLPKHVGQQILVKAHLAGRAQAHPARGPARAHRGDHRGEGQALMPNAERRTSKAERQSSSGFWRLALGVGR